MTNNTQKHEDDDGRVISEMNVAGMPWFDSKADARRRLFGPGRRRAHVSRAEEQAYLNRPTVTHFDKSSVRMLLRSSVLASLCIVGVYLLIFSAVILFLTLVW